MAQRTMVQMGQRSLSSLVFAEHNNKTLSSSTLSAVTAAHQLGGDTSLLVVGKDCAQVVAQASKVKGITKVLYQDEARLENPVAEDLVEILQSVQASGSYSHVLAPSNALSKSFLPRFSALQDVATISDIIKILSDDTFVRPIYAGNALSTIKSKDKLKVITVRTTSFEKAETTDSPVPTESLSVQLGEKGAKFVSQQVAQSDRPELTAASVVVSGGRGMDSEANFKILYDLADLFNGAVGASRAAVEAGFASNELQVGQTGKVVAPALYIAVGISGAIQHLAGMKDSKIIVAINKDADAPIFQVADYGLVGDLFKVVPELSDKVKAART